jgi:ABC-type phosphate transport system permease subunit
MLLLALGPTALLVNVLMDGAGRLSWSFRPVSHRSEQAGILSSLVGTLYHMFDGRDRIANHVAAAVYLEEYSKGWFHESSRSISPT